MGDGTFEAPGYLENGGNLGIGSDSNVLISVAGELRQLEYSQRLARRSRNVIAAKNGSVGRRLFDCALSGGGMALHAPSNLSVRSQADIVSLDIKAAPYLTADNILDHWLFAGGPCVESVWVAGVKRVEGGRHVNREAIHKRFLAAMQELLNG